MDEAGGELKFDWELELEKLKVIAAFARWLWFQEQLNQAVNSYDGTSSPDWLKRFAEQRRAARNAQFAWVTALYEFKRLVEAKVEDSGQEEN